MGNKIFNRKVGIEFEFSTPIKYLKEPLKKFFKENNIKLVIKKEWGHSNGKKWELKTDSSTESELVTPVMLYNDENWKFMKKLLIFTDEILHVKITKKDGLHVHFDVDDFEMNDLIIGWMFCEKAFTTIMKASRIKHKRQFLNDEEIYSRRVLYTTSSNQLFATKFRDSYDESFDRYSIYNLNNYSKNKTVEIRCHEGTNVFNDVENWVKFCLYFFKFMKSINIIDILTSAISEGVDESNVNYLFGLPEYLCTWYYIREQKYIRNKKI